MASAGTFRPLRKASAETFTALRKASAGTFRPLRKASAETFSALRKASAGTFSALRKPSARPSGCRHDQTAPHSGLYRSFSRWGRPIGAGVRALVARVTLIGVELPPIVVGAEVVTGGVGGMKAPRQLPVVGVQLPELAPPTVEG